MSSPYQVLGNRSIDQWKVTELKEELKRRKLATKGLKEDLIKRLDEALRNERENAEEDVDNGFDCPSSPEAVDKAVVTKPDNEDVVISDDGNKKVDGAAVQVDINEGVAALIQRENPEEITTESNNMVDKKQDICAISVETSTMVSENVVSEIAESVQEEQNNETQKESGAAKPQKEEDSKSTYDLMLKSSNSNNQVSEVNPVLGFQVKSDSISTDSVSINEKNEIKDNIIADNVKLDLDVIKPEMVEPSSSSVVPDGGELHPMDVEEPHEKKVPVEETDNNHSTDADLNKKNDSADMGSSEKLNLDRSSGDDSMEDDILESKQIDSKYNSDEVGNRSEQTEVPLVREEIHANIVGDVPSADTKEVHVEPKNKPVPPPEKRKLQDAVGGNIESSKRQRRWNAESLKVPEPQSSNLSPSTTPKDAFQATTLKRNFSRSDSTVSEDAPKERVVPPSPKPPTNSLRIDRFLRPFTLKAVQELLGKTGSVTSFWMDHIKTHCYVSYASVEEAMETRNAVYNLQWPPNGGRLLVAEFVDPQEVKTRAEAPQAPAAAAPVNVRPAVPPPPPPAKQPQPSPRKQQVSSRQQLPPPPPLLPLPPPPPLSNPPQTRERLPLPLPLPPPPPIPEKADLPIVTLDDLFQKTKATPRIYYLPLSEEQVAAKLKAQGKNTK